MEFPVGAHSQRSECIAVLVHWRGPQACLHCLMSVSKMAFVMVAKVPAGRIGPTTGGELESFDSPKDSFI